MSRQREWQIKKHADGKCVQCGKGPLVTQHRCARHAREDNERAKARYRKRKAMNISLDTKE